MSSQWSLGNWERRRTVGWSVGIAQNPRTSRASTGDLGARSLFHRSSKVMSFSLEWISFYVPHAYLNLFLGWDVHFIWCFQFENFKKFPCSIPASPARPTSTLSLLEEDGGIGVSRNRNFVWFYWQNKELPNSTWGDVLTSVCRWSAFLYEYMYMSIWIYIWIYVWIWKHVSVSICFPPHIINLPREIFKRKLKKEVSKLLQNILPKSYRDRKAWQREIFDTQAHGLPPTEHSLRHFREIFTVIFTTELLLMSQYPPPPHTHTNEITVLYFFYIKFWGFRRCITSGKVMSAAAFFNF